MTFLIEGRARVNEVYEQQRAFDAGREHSESQRK